MKKNPALWIPDRRHGALLIFFIYTDFPLVNSEASENERMQHLLVAADRYGLERLRLMCEAKLCQGIDVQTIATPP